jgi:hypothetical protein
MSQSLGGGATRVPSALPEFRSPPAALAASHQPMATLSKFWK